MTETKKATFAAGCFWGVESSFRQLEGVIDVMVGYTGGHVRNPTYEMVCSDRSGHAEAVEIEFDPSVVSYETLLEVLWEIHDPTTLNRQGPDFGSQYRSAIFYHDAEQQKAAEESKKRLDASGHFEDPIVTEIVPASTFYPAEEYHQRYYERMGLPNLCAIHVGGRK
jgi:peptide-methionine (S)-S-oxide reductase